MKSNLFKTSIIILLLLLVNNTALMAATQEASNIEPSNFLPSILFFLGGLTIAGALMALWNLYNVSLEATKRELHKELGIEPEVRKAPKESWWKTQFDKWNDIVPVEKEQDIMLDHDYDGIRELDNSLPPWWTAMFYITIIVGVIYFSYYHVFQYGDLSAAEYVAEMEMAEEEKKMFLARQSNLVDEGNVTLLVETNQLNKGRIIYEKNCVSCHGAQGEGGIGPNMVDNYWLHGGDIKSVFKTIKYGVPKQGMAPWQSLLRPSEIQEVASFIKSLAGTEVANPKEPQGELYEESTTAENE